MKDFWYLIQNFFTHKDYLVSADQIPGTLFTPLHFVCAIIILALVVTGGVLLGKKATERQIKIVFTVIWAFAMVFEVVKMLWESLAGKEARFEVGGILPLYPCSVFLYAMPFAIFGKNNTKASACGYVCTIGFIGALINFVYPANILSNYSCISFAGLHTLLYHGAMLMVAITMLVSGYHRYTNVTKFYQLLLPSVPLLCVSVIANAVNYSPIGSDYMFFKGDSFLFSSIFGNIPNWATTIIMYIAYIVICGVFYLPSYINNKIKAKNLQKCIKNEKMQKNR